MMVETILEAPTDLGMSNGTVPQWKRELLQRRAARAVPPAPPPDPAPPPEDEELRYGPGIVKRLKSRYLSLALRGAPPRRPSVLRRAASLEHLQPPAPRRARPVSTPAPPAAIRRDAVKRARSVDALSRLDETLQLPAVPVPPPAPPPPALPRAPRPPRRPTPLLRDTERPPPDVVRAALRKFEAPAGRRAPPAARVPGVLRSHDDEVDRRPAPRFPADTPTRAIVPHKFPPMTSLPPSSAPTPVLLDRAPSSPRRVGVIKPMQHAAPRTPSPRPAPPTAESTPLPEPKPAPVTVRAMRSPSPPPVTRVRTTRTTARSAGSTSVVFDFSKRAEVPDYIENDGLIIRASRRDKLKAGDPGVVVLRGGGGATDSDAEEDEADGSPRAVSPCCVRFFNDNVLINGRSSLTQRPRRNDKLKLQFDDSLTVTFEYPSETSLGDDDDFPTTTLHNNTSIGAVTLSSYRPSKSAPAPFSLGLAPPPPPPPPPPGVSEPATEEGCGGGGGAEGRGCGEDARSFSRARDLRTDLLF